MRLRVILLVLAIGSLILVSFMLPLALLLRSFAANSAISSATIRAQFVAPLLVRPAGDLRKTLTGVNQNQQEPVTIIWSNNNELGPPTPISKGILLARTGQSFSEPAP